MIILGINANVHDSSVAVLEEGRIRYATEEERLNRKKHFGGFPEKALRRALDIVGGPERIDLVVHPWLPWRFYRYELRENLPRLFGRRVFLHLHQIFAAHNDLAAYLNIERRFRRPPWRGRFAHCEHHLAHAASAFYASPFAEAAILTMDARGEAASTRFWVGRGTEITPLGEIRLPHSLGHLYAQITAYLGYGSNDEYKVMGLAPYGRPAYKAWFDGAVELQPRGRYRIRRRHMDYYRGFTAELLRLGPPRSDGTHPDQWQKDMAASLQTRFEDAVLHMTAWLRTSTGMKNLCIAGGCGLNAVVNGRIAREGGFEGVWVQPASSDAGLSLGAALWGAHGLLGQPRTPAMDRADLGDEFSEEEIERTLRRFKIRYARMDNPERTGAEIIAAGGILGWFHGRSEFGPRALGRRSILADPRRPDMKDRVNSVIKNREGYRPFAPACREEDVAEYFEWGGALPFMIFVFPVRQAWRDRLPAITHVDGTARIQTVRRRDNERYWSLIGHFRDLTGVGVVLNTSFNLQGEPIVNSPADAVRTFYSSGLDALLLERFLVRKDGVPS
ncbi:MAG: carbamoyltransferase C-terminal domain-containing protein [Planctomycetota bacterium]